MPEFDPTDHLDQAILREQMPAMTGNRFVLDDGMSEDEKRAEIWQAMEDIPKIKDYMTHDYNPY